MKEEVLKRKLCRVGVTESISKEQIIRFFDKSLSVVCDVRPTAELHEGEVIKHIKSYMETSSQSETPPLRLTVHLPLEIVQHPEVGRFVLKLSELYEDNLMTHLVIHSTFSPYEWENLRVMLKSLRDKLKHPRSCHVECIAPFDEFHQDEMETLFNLGLRIRYAAGWLGDSSSSSIPKIQRKTLRQLSQMGFQCPIEWYIHKENIDRVENLLPELLFENYWSGFALPLVSENPFYRFKDDYPSLPDAADYASLLVRCYQCYSCYDAVMEPLSRLMMRTRECAWHKKFNLPQTIKLNIDQGGRVGCYLQVPSLANYCSSIDDFSRLSSEELKKSFVKSVNEIHVEKLNIGCQQCAWQMLCNGLDTNSTSGYGTEQRETLCVYQKLFFKHFMSIRAPHLRV